ncbi:hypothetical protein Trydic_g286, partial [Trypoxylus dichotomus]
MYLTNLLCLKVGPITPVNLLQDNIP